MNNGINNSVSNVITNEKWVFKSSYINNLICKVFINICFIYSNLTFSYEIDGEKRRKFYFIMNKIIENTIGDHNFNINSYDNMNKDCLDVFMNHCLKSKEINQIKVEEILNEKLNNHSGSNENDYDDYIIRILNTTINIFNKETEKIKKSNAFDCYYSVVLNDLLKTNRLFTDLIINFEEYLKLIEIEFNKLFNIDISTDFIKNVVLFSPILQRLNEFFEIYTKCYENSKQVMNKDLIKRILNFLRYILRKETIVLITSINPVNFFKSVFMKNDKNEELLTLLNEILIEIKRNSIGLNENTFISEVITQFIDNLKINKNELDEEPNKIQDYLKIMSSFLRLNKLILKNISYNHSTITCIKKFNILLNIFLNSDHFIILLDIYFTEHKMNKKEFEVCFFNKFNKKINENQYLNKSKFRKKRKYDFLEKQDFESLEYIKPHLEKFIYVYLKYINYAYKYELWDLGFEFTHINKFNNIYSYNFENLSIDVLIQLIKNSFNFEFKGSDRLCYLCYFQEEMFYSNICLRINSYYYYNNYYQENYAFKKSNEKIYASLVNYEQYFDILEKTMKLINRLIDKYVKLKPKQSKLKKEFKKLVKNIYEVYEDLVIIPLYLINNISFLYEFQLKKDSFKRLKRLNTDFMNISIRLVSLKIEYKANNVKVILIEDNIPMVKINKMNEILKNFMSINMFDLTLIVRSFRLFIQSIIKDTFFNINYGYFFKFINTKNNFFDNTYINSKDFPEILVYQELYSKYEIFYSESLDPKSFKRNIIQIANDFKNELIKCNKEEFSLINVCNQIDTSSKNSELYRYKLTKFFENKQKEYLDLFYTLSIIKNIKYLYYYSNYGQSEDEMKIIKNIVFNLFKDLYINNLKVETSRHYELIKDININNFCQEILVNIMILLRICTKNKSFTSSLLNENDLIDIIFTSLKNTLNILISEEKLMYYYNSESLNINEENINFLNFQDESRLKCDFLRQCEVVVEIFTSQEFSSLNIDNFPSLKIFIETISNILYSNNLYVFELYNEIIYKSLCIIQSLIEYVSLSPETINFLLSKLNVSYLTYIIIEYTKIIISQYQFGINDYQSIDLLHGDKNLLYQRDYKRFYLNSNFLIAVTIYKIILILDSKYNINHAKSVISSKFINEDKNNVIAFVKLIRKILCYKTIAGKENNEKEGKKEVKENANKKIKSIKDNKEYKYIKSSKNLPERLKVNENIKKNEENEEEEEENEEDDDEKEETLESQTESNIRIVNSIVIDIITQMLNNIKEDNENKSDYIIKDPLSRERKYQLENKNHIAFINDFYSNFIVNVEFIIKKSYKNIKIRVIPESISITNSEIEDLVKNTDYTSSTTKISSLMKYINTFENKINFFKKKDSFHEAIYDKVKSIYFDIISFIICLIINILLLVYYEKKDLFINDLSLYWTILILGIIQILNNFISLSLFLISKYKVLLYEYQINKQSKLNFVDSLFVLISSEINMTIANLIISIIAISQPFLTFLFTIQLLSILKFLKTIREIFIAFSTRIKQVIIMIFLLVIIVYFFSNIAFFYLANEFNISNDDQTSTLNPCTSLIECFIFHFKDGIMNGGGIGDVLSEKSWGKDLKNYFQRWFFDFFFFLICILLLLNMINGIIVNAFVDIRKKDEEYEYESKEKCFICSLTKNDFQIKNISFKNHILNEHQVKSYVHYLIYLKFTQDADLDEDNLYIKNAINEKNFSVFPFQSTSYIKD